jgi:hypothetical protein
MRTPGKIALKRVSMIKIQHKSRKTSPKSFSVAGFIEHLGVFLSQNTIPKAFGTPLARQVPSNYAVPDPMAFPLSKALQAACPMHDT